MRRLAHSLALAALALAALVLVGAGAASFAATAPEQPKSGPGGSDYAVTEVARRGIGQASFPVYVFHPAADATAPRPVVVFLPAWGVDNPMVYGDWIAHLARKGNLVVFPRYQQVGRTRPSEATALAAEMLRDTLAKLKDDPQAKPDLDRVVLVGHLAGAGIAANLAARAEAERLPVPRLVFAVMPGGITSDPKARGIALADLGEISARTSVVALVGDREHLPSQRQAARLLKEATAVPFERKLLLRALSDDHGFPTLVASLSAPAAPNDAYDAAKIPVPPDPPNDERVRARARQKWSADMALSGEQTVLARQMAGNVVDALDYLAFWRSLDRLMQAAFAGENLQSLKREDAFASMGTWSDGWPVRRLGVGDPPR